MKFMILAVEPPNEFAQRDVTGAAFEAYIAPWQAYGSEMQEAGIMVAGAALEKPETATTLQVRNGKRIIQDGPYADSKEQLGGFWVIDVPDMTAAKKWAAKCPATISGHAQVHPIMDLGQDDQQQDDQKQGDPS